MKNTILLFVILTALSCEIVPQIPICQHEVIEHEIIGSVIYENDGITETVDVISYYPEVPACEEAVICQTCGRIMQVNRINLTYYEHTFTEY